MEFSFGERGGQFVMACAAIIGWLYFIDIPDTSRLSVTPLAQLTLTEIVSPLLWLGGTLWVGYFAISMFYQAFAGRDSVWFWHP